MRIRLTPDGRVDLHTAFEVPAERDVVWDVLSDFETFACRDLFHTAVELQGDGPAAGVPIRLRHGFAGVGFDRLGRILTWREGSGYAFSDLSARHPQQGFPHVYWYRLSDTRGGTRIDLGVGGRWTARRMPRVLVLAWLAVIWLGVRLRVENTMLRRLRDRLSRREERASSRRRPRRSPAAGLLAGPR